MARVEVDDRRPTKQTAGPYDVLETVRCSAAFFSDANILADPVVVKFQFVNLVANIVTTYTYGVDAQLVKDATGLYHVDLNPGFSGIWGYRFSSTLVAKEAEFIAQETMYASPV